VSKKRIPTPPGPLPEGSPGHRYWTDVHNAYVIPEPQQQEVLYQAALVLNRIAELDAAMEGQPLLVIGGNRQQAINPLLQHQKDLRGTFLAYTRAAQLPLDFGDEEEADKARRRSERARDAANARWGKVAR
jgi:hypothetical protein